MSASPNCSRGRERSITIYDAGFFVAEPQVSVVWRAAEWMSVSAGIGYRAVAGADSLNQEFRGATGSVAIRFGSSGK